MRQTKHQDLLELLLPIVRTAGGAIMAIYRRGSIDVAHKVDTNPVTEADLEAHHVLATQLTNLCAWMPNGF